MEGRTTLLLPMVGREKHRTLLGRTVYHQPLWDFLGYVGSSKPCLVCPQQSRPQRKACTALDDEVFMEVHEVHAGCGLLTMTLWHLFHLLCSNLINKSVKAKKCWLKLIEAGWQSALTQETGLPSSKISYKGIRDKLCLWMVRGDFNPFQNGQILNVWESMHHRHSGPSSQV